MSEEVINKNETMSEDMYELENFHKILDESNILKCVQCGKCTGGCPAGRQSRIRIRELIHLAHEGEDIKDAPELWLCTTCYTCQERCPKGVDTTEAVISLRNRAIRKGDHNFPEIHMTAITSLRDQADGFPLSPDVESIRSVIGLPKHPFDLAHDEEGLKKFQELMDDLGILDLVKNQIGEKKPWKYRDTCLKPPVTRKQEGEDK
ncbi:MAG: 4Fe-4S dicluster domain-containing protein [Candidatus Methanofastidiosia archaeon]